MSNAKERLLAGTILSAVVLGSVHAAPLAAGFVVAQAPQGEQEKDKKPPPQRPGQRQKQQEERRQEAARRSVRCNRRRVRSLRAVRRNVRCSRHRHRVRSRRHLRQARSSRISAASAVLSASRRVPLRRSSRSERPPSLLPRCNLRPHLPAPPRRKRNASLCPHRPRTMRADSMTCAAPAGKCARAIGS